MTRSKHCEIAKPLSRIQPRPPTLVALFAPIFAFRPSRPEQRGRSLIIASKNMASGFGAESWRSVSTRMPAPSEAHFSIEVFARTTIDTSQSARRKLDVSSGERRVNRHRSRRSREAQSDGIRRTYWSNWSGELNEKQDPKKLAATSAGEKHNSR